MSLIFEIFFFLKKKKKKKKKLMFNCIKNLVKNLSKVHKKPFRIYTKVGKFVVRPRCKQFEYQNGNLEKYLVKQSRLR